MYIWTYIAIVILILVTNRINIIIVQTYVEIGHSNASTERSNIYIYIYIGMSEIVDFFLQPYMPTIPSSIKDTDDFIRRIRNIIDLPSDVLLVTFDVVSLYPCIPHDFGLCALRDFLMDRNLPNIVVNGIHNMTELVLKKNVFEFNSECFLQTSGTAIGTKMAPA